jgi:hypothetical protein
MYGEVDVQNHVFLTSALVGSERSASRLGRFTSVKNPRYPLERMGGLQNRFRRGKENSYP